VLMSDFTWKNIEDIEVGEEVVGVLFPSNGKHLRLVKTKVQGVFSREDVVYRVTTDKGVLRITENHPVLDRFKHWRAINPDTAEVKAYKLRVSDTIKTVGKLDIEIKVSKDYMKGYVFGILKGDGTNVDKVYYYNAREHEYLLKAGYKNVVKRRANFIRFWQKDKEIINRIECYLNSLGITKGYWRRDSSDGHKLVVVGERELDFLRNLKFTKSNDFLAGFLAGMFDAEGSVTPPPVIRISNFNSEILSMIGEALEWFNFQFTLEKTKGKTKGIRVLGGINESIRFFSITKPVLKYKIEKLYEITPRGYATVIDIKKEEKMKVYNIQTGTENYIANGFLVHNCFVYKLYQDIPRQEMTKETMDSLLHFARHNLRSNGRIWFFGGEPLVSFNTMKYITEKAIADNLQIQFGLTTNCYLLDKEKVKWLSKYNYGILCSIDGLEETHDKFRVLPNGKGTWRQVWKNIKLVRKYLNPNPQLRWTFSPETVDGIAKGLLFFLKEGLTNIAIDAVYEVKWTEEDLRNLRIELEEVRRILDESYSRKVPVFSMFVRDCATAINNRRRINWISRCGLGQGGIGVAPDGKLYPCFTPDVNVITSSGVKRIGEVRIGDLVLTHTGKYRKVVEIMKRKFKGKLYVVHPYLLPEVKCTPEHPFYVKLGDRFQWITAEELSKIYKIRRIGKNYSEDEIPFLVVKFNTEIKDIGEIKLRDLFDDLYYNKKTDTVIALNTRTPIRNTIPIDEQFLKFIGWFIAEGHLVERDSYIGFTFSSDEMDVAEEIKKYLEWLGCSVTMQVNRERHSIKLLTYNKVIYKLLNLLVGRNSHSKSIHPLLKMLPPRKQEILLKALFKGDGTWYRKEANLSTISKQLAFDVFEMLLRVKSIPKLKMYHRKHSWKDEHSIEYRIFIYGCEGEYEIRQRKRQRGRAYVEIEKGEAYFPIFKITKVDYDGYVYNLEVEVDESYTANLIVVHNCHRFVSSRTLDIGDVFSGFSPRRIHLNEEWRKTPPYSERPEKCLNCKFKNACSGGCLAVNYDLFGNLHIVPESMCDIKNLVVEVFTPLVKKYSGQDWFRRIFNIKRFPE